MAVAYSTVTQLGLFSQQYPPPLLPKPGKDNVRLQKLLKRTAKKKSSAQALQSATTFRSSLSPVDEASPDQEYSDHSISPRTPEITPSLYSIQHPPRFTVRPLYQHVASPYPQQARATRIFPQMKKMMEDLSTSEMMMMMMMMTTELLQPPKLLQPQLSPSENTSFYHQLLFWYKTDFHLNISVSLLKQRMRWKLGKGS
ncbi:uncharacterized protein prr33 isoform X2 [Kryptolebias marmoratus]|uniref:uncharacterized protein prr33 isoform X2 n=1 Tax=Kryptolebias marmoratus TaxID=37003 RepID=UPI000D530E85|nr:uncharacterized protein prr33 isoform X2 [Kryptolebias marmoratus]